MIARPLDKAVCLVVKKAGNFELVPFNIENEVGDKYEYETTNSLTCIAIWPHKDEQDELDDVRKQVCLKFVELKEMTYAQNLRETSSVKALMDKLTETERKYVDAIMVQYVANRDKKVTNEGTAFSSELIEINLDVSVQTPAGIIAVDEEKINEVAFRHASEERLKEVVRPALLTDYEVKDGEGKVNARATNGKVNGLLRTLNAEPTEGNIHGSMILFHPFALQINTMLNKLKAEADKLAQASADLFKVAHEAIRQKAKSTTPLFTSDYFPKLKAAHEPIWKALDQQLLEGRKTNKLHS